MGHDPAVELGKTPDTKISKLGAWEEAAGSQVPPADIASVVSQIRSAAAHTSCRYVDQWSDANLP